MPSGGSEHRFAPSKASSIVAENRRIRLGVEPPHGTRRGRRGMEAACRRHSGLVKAGGG